MPAAVPLDDDRTELVRMLRDSAAAIAPRGGTLSRVRALRWTEPGFSMDTWKEMAGLGWIGLHLPERHGGVAAGMAEGTALYEELGRALVPEPLLAANLSAALLAATDQTDLLSALLAGEALVATAWQSAPDATHFPEGPAPIRHLVPMPGAATHLLVPTRENGRTRLRLLDAAAAAWTPRPRQDGTQVATVQVPDTAGTEISADLGDALDQALDEAALGTAAYLLGMAEAAFALTLDYLKQRRQFGQPLAAFQALQHRAADIHIQLTLTRASLDAAAAELDTGASPRSRAAAASRAKARAADTALLVGREAVQLHGAIGYADEHDIGLFTRKAMATANDFGSALAHRRRFAALDDEA